MAATRLPGTPRLLRALNDRAALELLLTHGPLTRARIGELTGLSKVTASQLVERLEERGLVRRVGEQAGGRGPNAQLYAVEPDSAHVIGVDVCAMRVIAACADITGTIIARVELSTLAGDRPVEVVHQTVLQAAGQVTGAVRRVVIGTPGRVDPVTGEVAFAGDPPPWHHGLHDALRADVDTPIHFANDVNLAAIAEAQSGAAKDSSDFVLIWVGQELGLATVIGGRIHQGSTGAAGEIGYLPVAGADVPRRTSGRGVTGGLQELAGPVAVGVLARRHGFPGAAAAAVRAAATAGDAGAAVLDELARRLALGVAGACLVLDPPLVVLAGEVARAGGPALAAGIEREVRAISTVSPHVVISTVQAEPVLYGALRSGLDAVRDEVFGSTTG